MGIIPSNTAVGPLGFRAEVATDAESEQSRPYRGLEVDGPDSTVVVDNKVTRTLQIVSLENRNEGQGLAATGVSTPVTVVGGTQQGNGPTSERF